MKYIKRIFVLTVVLSSLLFAFYNIDASSESTDMNSREISEVFAKPLSELTKEELKVENDFQEAIANAPIMQATSYTAKAGDILYTPSTQCTGSSGCKGITGHVGIVSNLTSFVYHIAGKNDTPGPIMVSDWLKKYPKTIVVRPKTASEGVSAGTWARDYYSVNPGASKTYSVTSSRSLSSSTVYCSLIPYHGYKHGAGRNTGEKTVGIIWPVEFVNTAGWHNMEVHARIGY